MAAGIEDRVEIVLTDAIEPRRVGEARLGRLVRLEPAGEIGLKFGFIALWVQRRLTALGRGKRDLGSGVEKDVIGRSELFQPEACLSACVAEPVVRGEDDEDFHGFLLFRGACSHAWGCEKMTQWSGGAQREQEGRRARPLGFGKNLLHKRADARCATTGAKNS